MCFCQSNSLLTFWTVKVSVNQLNFSLLYVLAINFSPKTFTYSSHHIFHQNHRKTILNPDQSIIEPPVLHQYYHRAQQTIRLISVDKWFRLIFQINCSVAHSPWPRTFRRFLANSLWWAKHGFIYFTHAMTAWLQHETSEEF